MNTLLTMVALEAKAKGARFLFNEEGEVNIVTTVVLIGIAIALAAFFGDEVKGLLDKMFDTLQTKSTAAVDVDYN